MKKLTRGDVVIRPYQDDDASAVVRLLQDSLEGGPAGAWSQEFFRWKHLDNPFGRSAMLICEVDGQLAGLRAFMRWRFETGSGTWSAVRAVDTATHPEHQGRGIFSILTREALDRLEGDADLVFNTPNEKSLPGYLKMGWRTIGTIGVRVRVRRPLAILRSVRSIRLSTATSSEATRPAPALDGALADPGLAGLLSSMPAPDGAAATAVSPGYLRWRYADPPGLDYDAVVERDGDDLLGIAFYRIRSRGRLREASVGDLFVRSGNALVARRLLRSVARTARVDHAVCSFPAGSPGARAALGAGYLPAPVRVTLVCNPLRPGLSPDPMRRSSWALTLGDVEVF